MINNLFNKGYKIKPKDIHLVMRFVTARIAIIALILAILFYGYSFIKIDWSSINLTFINDIKINSSNFIFYLLTTIFICIGVTFLYYKKFFDKYKQLVHRQKNS